MRGHSQTQMDDNQEQMYAKPNTFKIQRDNPSCSLWQ